MYHPGTALARASLALMIACLLALGAPAQVTLSHMPASNRYAPGATLDITVTIAVNSSAQLNAIGVDETLPSGWSYDSVVGLDGPGVVPNHGDTGLVSFAWFPLPDVLPVSFTYRVDIDAAATGTKTLSGHAIVLLEGVGEVSANQSTIVPKEGSGPFHTADTDLSSSISLTELLRLIQFYNLGGFHCADFQEDTEDGFVPGALGPKACQPHNSDYNPQDWAINFGELLRAIQFYNSGGLFACPDDATEDGFCPGFPP